jgi:hypothetical protein
MPSKAEKISELTELLRSGALSQHEFEVLTKEIIQIRRGQFMLDEEENGWAAFLWLRFDGFDTFKERQFKQLMLTN